MDGMDHSSHNPDVNWPLPNGNELISRYRALIECVPIGISVSDAAGNIIETNRMAETLLGLSRTEHVNRQIDAPEWHLIRPDGSLMPPEEYPSVRALQVQLPVHNVEMGIVNPDQPVTWISVSAAPIDTERGGVVIAYSDITERKRERDLLKAMVVLGECAETHTLEVLLRRLLDEAEHLTDSKLGLFHFLDADQKTLILQTWSTRSEALRVQGLHKDMHMGSLTADVCHGVTAEGPRDAATTGEESQAEPDACGHDGIAHQGVWAECIKARTPIIHNECQTMSHSLGLPDGHTPVTRLMLVPVIHAGRVVAILGLGNRALPYQKSDVGTVCELTRSVWDIIRRKQAESALAKANAELAQALQRERQLASTDELTGIRNRRAILEEATRELAVSCRYKRPFSMLLLDLDHFKQVNDHHGHAVGDVLLAEVAHMIRSTLRATDVVGRLGGEEFLVLMPMTPLNRAVSLAERIRTQVREQAIPISDGTVGITVSIGVVAHPNDDTEGEMDRAACVDTCETLISRADAAMYAAKEAGRDCVRIG